VTVNRFEQLAQWYLRLNGFLTWDNFVIHSPDGSSLQRTDVDVVGVRFRHRCELVGNRQLRDDECLKAWLDHNILALAEVKPGQCKLNGPTRDPDARNLQLALHAVGALPVTAVERVASVLYRDGFWESDDWVAALICFGREKRSALDPNDRSRFQKVEQITWDHILRFVFQRYKGHWRQKSQHQQWPEIGDWLWREAGLMGRAPADEDWFVAKTLARLGNT
jgi:hypothetical protein